MESLDAIESLNALAHPGRLAVFRLLVRHTPQGVSASEIAAALGIKPNTLSVYLKTLERAGILQSERDGRTIYYRAVLAQMGALVDYLYADCCRGRPDQCAIETARAITQPPPSASVLNVLFICTGNSARSIMAEALLNRIGAGRFRAVSAGVDPRDAVHPVAKSLLQQSGEWARTLTPKSLTQVGTAFDFVFTVCDRAAHEECPRWTGPAISAHWGVADPAILEESPAHQALLFTKIYAILRRRITALCDLPLDRLDRLTLQHRLDEIGQDNDPFGD